MKTALNLMVACAISTSLHAQFATDFGVHLGAANYLGEIGGTEEQARGTFLDMQINQSRYASGIHYRRHISPWISIVGTMDVNRIQGADSLSYNPQRVSRNLSFRNDMLHTTARVELNLLRIYDINNNLRAPIDLTIFSHAGVGILAHSPKAYYQGEWVKLRPLMTEGQMRPYRTMAFSAPMGAGGYVTINRHHRFGWEFSWAATNTDYLDDISTVYADPENLSSDLAVMLANRYQNAGVDAGNFEAGSPRGGDANDHLMTTTFSYAYVIKGKYKRKHFYQKHGGAKLMGIARYHSKAKF